MASREEQLEKIALIAQDFYLYCENNLKILDKTNQIVPLKPNRAQRELIDYVIECLEEGKPIRVIILKARQMGLSTIVEALIYWWTATHENVNSKIVAHDRESAEYIYGMFDRYYENCNPIFQPKRKYHTRKDLKFDTDEGDGLKSTISTSSAEVTSIGRGQTISCLHASEVAEWRDGKELVSGLFQAVPLLPKTMIFLESTAKGIGDYFHTEWQASKRGDSVFKPFFFPWYYHAEYQMETEPLTHLDKEEMELRDKGVTDEQLAWRRYKIKEFSGDIEKFREQYPATDMEAFIAAGRPAFDTKKIYKWEPKDPMFFNIDKGKLVQTERSPLKVWEVPKAHKKYTIGVDVAEGLSHGDYSVVDIMDDSLLTVARWRGHVDPDVLGDIVVDLGHIYNTALVGVEVNNHGLTTLQRIRDKFYRNLYRRERGMEEMFEESTSKLGWKTDVRTKPLMVDKLREVIRDGVIRDYDEVFKQECLSYVVDDNGRTNAQEGSFDDTVVAKAINLMMYEWQFVNYENIKVHKPSKYTKRR